MRAASRRDAMTLSQLLAGLAGAPVPDVTIDDVAMDSRNVGAGGLFLACLGTRAHGLDFLSHAVAAGVRAVAWEPADGVEPPTLPAGVVAVPVNDLSRHAGLVAGRFFGHPSESLAIAAITGTNGKTTTAHLVAGAATALGMPAASMGTLGVGRPGRLQPQALTTPDAVSVQRTLAGLAADGIGRVAMEVSSHALAQHRVAGLHFDTAVFTNLSRDHLDYHGSLAEYSATKRELFRWPGLRAAAINVADASGVRMMRALEKHVDAIAVCPRGTRVPPGIDFVAGTPPETGPAGLVLDVRTGRGNGRLVSPLLGAFNGDNLLAAVAVLLGWNVPLEDALGAFAGVGAPPGRMEVFGNAGAGPLVVVDYAHTPDALENALKALREHCRGRLWCVFGCGGERDRGKRPMMGALAARLADAVVVTDDNPRGEDGDRIVRDIVAGASGGAAVVVERDRRAAIVHAFESAVTGDIVLIAGKGHESIQDSGGERRPFSDRQVAAELTGGVR